MASRTTYQTHFLLGAKVQSSMHKSFSKVQKNMKNIRKSAGYTESAYSKLGRTMKRALGAAGIYFSARTIVTALKSSTQAAMEFEDQMADVGTLLDGNVKEKLGNYSEQVKQTAIATGISTEQLNRGLYETISALGESADTYDIFQKAAENARGGNADVQNVVKFLSATMKGYGDVSAETAQKVSDLGFQTVKLGQTSFPELAQNMGDVVPLAGAMGANMESVFGAMATLTGVTGDTAKVSTQLRGVFTALTKPTSAMKEVINGLGYESGAAMIKAKGFQGTLNLLKKATGGSTEQLSKMFGRVEALNAVIALTGAQSENFTTKTEAMYQAVGASNEAFKDKVKTSKALRERFGQLINVLKINFGNKVLPYINQGLEFILANYKEMGAQAKVAMEPVRATYNFIKNNWTAIEPIVVGITSAMIAYKTTQIALTAAQKAGMIVQTISKAYSTFQATMNAARYSTLAASKAQVALNLAMSANPAAVVAIAIGALATAGYLVYKNWDKILPKLRAFYNLIKNLPVVEAFIGGITDIYESGKETFNGLVDFVSSVFTGNWSKAWDGVVQAVGGSFSLIGDLVKLPINNTIGLINTALAGIGKIDVSIPDWVPGVGGKSFGPDIPEIPLLAKGTNNFGGGIAIVGEQGPELVNMPQGTQVTTATKTETLIQKLKETPSKATQVLNNLKSDNSTKNTKIEINIENIIKGNADKKDLERSNRELRDVIEEVFLDLGGNPRTDFS